jgi:nitrogen fixation/metabolism regulation signal transduction histidine kinase
MGMSPILTQPVTGEVGPEGHLIRADEPLRRLHLRAGGIDGGTLAIPGLLALVRLTQKLKMRLARNVRVAQGEDDFELWIETAYYEGLVSLSIQGWEAFLETDDHQDHINSFTLAAGVFSLQFDQAMRLIASGGAVPADFDRKNFGQEIFDILALDDDQTAALKANVAKHALHRELSILLSGGGNAYGFEANPVFAKDGNFTGYICAFSPIRPEQAAPRQPTAPSVLFAQQLAPALRQPLGRIIANAETIGSKLQGPIRENYAVYAKDIADAARHLVALVDDLGDLEAVERPDFSTARDSIELGDLARRVAGLLALKAADHQITIITPHMDDKITASAEFRRVLQILLNLVTNAIRYSPDGTEVRIQIAERADMAEISVQDQGAGVSDADQEKIFAKFERLGRTGDGGSGLGLYISRRLARFMGGDLTVETLEQGGAKFTLTLPKE